ncbi:hypothetical protein [Bifidobacterium leontopitheci]|uniref:Uncharacterized protein n=1 Tax=Bifidobacterium leontopitheci TaxID=2650774 RepID=A0A6I1GFW8_9BIFI|nr:hypothetical protein [Bifidobacterium leontopitheci]KAB7789592.1 hypothetical protein F7D09_1888 [Bifidobacterium leontopitheci]
MNDTVTAVTCEAAGGAAVESDRTVFDVSSVSPDAAPDAASAATLSIEQMLAAEGVMVSTTSGWSMWPLLRNRRDTIIVRSPADVHADGLPHRHDVVLYHRPADPATGVREAYVLHRIVDVERGASSSASDSVAPETVYIIRGDNTFVDEHVPAHQIIGILDGCYRANRPVDLEGRRYRAYVRVWLAIYPLRRLWHAGWTMRLRPALARTPLRALWKALRARR